MDRSLESPRNMRGVDLDLRELLDFDPKGGVLRFAGQRALLLDAVHRDGGRSQEWRAGALLCTWGPFAAEIRAKRAPVTRPDGRSLSDHRPVEILPGFHRNAEGSVLYRAGGTVVLCTASVDSSVPMWMAGKGKGWLTAEYQMHPRSSPQKREQRDGRGKAPSGRTQEIQRLIGRALRAAVDLDKLGERTLALDCDVLEADGGTRTASITGSFVAVAIALDKLRRAGTLAAPVLRDQVAAISVGHLEGGLALDLCYKEDAAARVDLNLVATARAAIVEVQGTAEGEAVPRAEIDAMVDLGLAGVASLAKLQREALAAAGVDAAQLFQPGRWS